MSIVILSFALAFFMLDLIIPNYIYMNPGIALLVTGWAAVLTENPFVLTAIFGLSLVTSIVAIRPRVIIYERNREIRKKMKAKYLGKIAQVVETTGRNSGVLSIDNERWQARSYADNVFTKGQNVRIKNCKNITMYIDKV